ncbi:hypothetical protein GGD65_008207 [Bradyrhizobium sp. CIR18]|nr:hypothetical protein [Bradyrhizobium sp. CIR18]
MPNTEVNRKRCAHFFAETTLNTSGGKPASSASFAIASVVKDVSSAGLMTIALPIASGGGTERPVIWSG